MSEYQYYEFRTVDRRLTESEIVALRNISTRAVITATSFTNTYEYGRFKGDPYVMMETCFDLFVHVTNWGMKERLHVG